MRKRVVSSPLLKKKKRKITKRSSHAKEKKKKKTSFIILKVDDDNNRNDTRDNYRSIDRLSTTIMNRFVISAIERLIGCRKLLVEYIKHIRILEDRDESKTIFLPLYNG